MANVTTTTAANFIPEMWRDAILDYAERKFQLKIKCQTSHLCYLVVATFLISLK